MKDQFTANLVGKMGDRYHQLEFFSRSGMADDKIRDPHRRSSLAKKEIL